MIVKCDIINGVTHIRLAENSSSKTIIKDYGKLSDLEKNNPNFYKDLCELIDLVNQKDSSINFDKTINNAKNYFTYAHLFLDKVYEYLNLNSFMHNLSKNHDIDLNKVLKVCTYSRIIFEGVGPDDVCDKFIYADYFYKPKELLKGCDLLVTYRDQILNFLSHQVGILIDERFDLITHVSHALLKTIMFKSQMKSYKLKKALLDAVCIEVNPKVYERCLVSNDFNKLMTTFRIELDNLYFTNEIYNDIYNRMVFR